jgi:putative long chain acyl-CoA synthase
VTRLGTAAQNALEIARFGGLETGDQPSPYEVASEQRVYRLRHYYAHQEGQDAHQERQDAHERPAGGPPVILVPPMMLAAEVYDVSPATSAVTILRDHGADPWVVDFGAPERERGGLERTLADHVLAVSDAVDRVHDHTGRDVHLGGYSQGGMFCYQTAAYRRGEGVSSLVTFGSPVDTRAGIPLGLPERFVTTAAGLIAEPANRWALPAWASRTGFRLLDPMKSLRNRVDFLLQLHDRDALLPREGQRRFLEGEGWVAWPGPAMAEFLRQFIAHNRMLEGGFVVEDRLVTLADISAPILYFVGTVDEIAPAPAVRAIRHAAPRADVYEVAQHAGHFGLVVGSRANATSWPTVAAWTRWREGEGELPGTVVPVEDVPERDEAKAHVGNRLGYSLELAGGVGVDVARSVLRTTGRAVRSARELTREAAAQLPRLARLEQIQPSTRISLGLLVAERRRKAPGDLFFLFEDRAYDAQEINQRIDNVVRGLISIGVRRGDHVGVLMSTRPSALALITAISRLGAVAVLMRPDGDIAREAQLGQVTRIIADPERTFEAAQLGRAYTFVLGGGGGPRELEVPLVTDMEQIDPDAVTLPRWYRPNPGRASDLAFILFTGEGPRTRMSRITNRRWALSAFGTASSAALSGDDTVYSVTPLYHPSGLMMSIGGAIAGGSRLAMASTFDPRTFWDEVRRYGVSVASYTWTLLHDLVEAPSHPGERHHRIRLFIGSGMPRGLWRRVERRFQPARVLEFYASTEAGAILVNVSGSKPGSMGRPLPGSAEVKIAAYDLERSDLELGDEGFARECEVRETGMLLARVGPRESLSVAPLRGVFAPEDAWVMTGDLFLRDEDGDYWRIDGLADVIHTAHGPVFSGPIRDALGDLPAVDLTVAYATSQDEHQLATAAVTPRRGRQLETRDLDYALAPLPVDQRPDRVHVVERIPVTTWYRPMTGALREAGTPEAAAGKPVWSLNRETGRYEALTAQAPSRALPS